MVSTYRESCTLRVTEKALQCVFSDLPLQVVRMIAEYYTETQRTDAASTLQAALQRHQVVR